MTNLSISIEGETGSSRLQSCGGETKTLVELQDRGRSRFGPRVCVRREEGDTNAKKKGKTMSRKKNQTEDVSRLQHPIGDYTDVIPNLDGLLYSSQRLQTLRADRLETVAACNLGYNIGIDDGVYLLLLDTTKEAASVTPVTISISTMPWYTCSCSTRQRRRLWGLSRSCQRRVRKRQRIIAELRQAFENVPDGARITLTYIGETSKFGLRSQLDLINVQHTDIRISVLSYQNLEPRLQTEIESVVIAIFLGVVLNVNSGADTITIFPTIFSS